LILRIELFCIPIIQLRQTYLGLTTHTHTMKQLLHILCVLFLFHPFISNAQNIPDEMHFSSDGKRLITGGLLNTGFYDLFTIHDMSLQFNEPHYWNDMKNNKAAGNNVNIMATLTINGNVYDSVGVRFKGNSSYSVANNDKKSFNITLDAYKPDQNISGYKTLNLNNCMGDESYMVEVIYEHQIAKHIPSLKGNFTHLFINGSDWGLYANVQQLNRRFIKEWFMDNEGALWRAEPPPGSPTHGHDGDSTSSLYYLGNSINTYMNNYNLKSSHVSNPYNYLMNMISEMASCSQSTMYDDLGDYLDIDRALWFIASENAFGDDDSYVAEAHIDYSIYYEPETGRCVPLEIDGNGALEYRYHNQDIFLNASNPNYALLYKLLNNPPIRQRYLAHMRTLVADELNVSAVHSLIDSLYTIIHPIVQNDPVANYTYTEFLDEVDNIKDFITDREDYITNDNEIDENLPVISNTIFYSGTNAWQRPVANQDVYVNAYAVSPDDINHVRLYYSTGMVGKFSKIEMYDDGNHHDQLAGDDIYGATIPGQSSGTWIRFYIEAESDNSAKTLCYDPPGAEHDVYAYLVQPSLALNTSIVINELMAKNVSTVADSSGKFSDWIELYNNSNLSVNIGGYYLTDDSLNLIKWQLPAGTVIPPFGYLTFWADDDKDAGTYHTNFKFSGDGEQLILLNSNREIVDQVSFGPQTDNLSYSRVPNGTGAFIIKQPTYGFNNNPHPVADFIVTSSTSGCAPLSVSFGNNSIDAINYEWNFGDGSTSSFESPVHTYTTAGDFTVTLTASYAGFSDIDSMVNLVNTIAAVPFDFPTDSVSTSALTYQLSAASGYTSYDWSTNETTQTISAGDNGQYCVVVTSPNGCTDSDCIFVVVDVLSVDELEALDFTYANPVNENLIIRSNFSGKLRIEIANVVGQKVYENNFAGNLIIDTHTWQDGVYFMRIGNSSRKFVVVH
jgi:PKD repeat protein